jgi:NAD(P)-dependent dehydrogenase (short-subunit alcohol dehydrogenase family)
MEKTALITGGTSGIGLATAGQLAAAGWTTIIVGRNRETLLAAQQKVRARAANGAECHIRQLDLADLAAVRIAGETLSSSWGSLAALICNAGVMAPPSRRMCAEGHELQFTVNHLAHVILAARLMPNLRNAGGRIVMVSSIRAREAPPGDAEPRPWAPAHYHPTRSYSISKAWNLAFALWLDTRLKADLNGVRAVAAHPGWARTALHDRGPMMDGRSTAARLHSAATRILAQSAEQGAVPIVAAATMQLADQPTYLGPSGYLELRGRRPAPAKIPPVIAEPHYQRWVGIASGKLARVAVPW